MYSTRTFTYCIPLSALTNRPRRPSDHWRLLGVFFGYCNFVTFFFFFDFVDFETSPIRRNAIDRSPEDQLVTPSNPTSAKVSNRGFATSYCGIPSVWCVRGGADPAAAPFPVTCNLSPVTSVSQGVALHTIRFIHAYMPTVRCGGTATVGRSVGRAAMIHTYELLRVRSGRYATPRPESQSVRRAWQGKGMAWQGRA